MRRASSFFVCKGKRGCILQNKKGNSPRVLDGKGKETLCLWRRGIEGIAWEGVSLPVAGEEKARSC